MYNKQKDLGLTGQIHNSNDQSVKIVGHRQCYFIQNEFYI